MIFEVFKQRYYRKGKKRISRLYRGRYRLDNDVPIIDIPLRTPDKQVAEERLRKIIKEKQQESAGIIAPKALRNAAQISLLDHLSDYIADLQAKGRDEMYIYNIGHRIRRVLRECSWKFPADVTADAFTTWRSRQNKAAKTLNEYLDTVNGFLNWMHRQGRLAVNPLLSVGKVQMQGREVRVRRAFTNAEIKKLVLCVPIERQALYLMVIYTGLRRAELGALTWGDVLLHGEMPYLKVRASTTKNHKEVIIWLHTDVIRALKAIVPGNADKSAKVFGKLPRMEQFREDLAKAGIQYKDSQGRQADFHALRHSFSTNLARAGVNPRIAMELMRHSDMRLTQKTYTDALQLPTSEAIESLPSIMGESSQLSSQKLGVGCHLVAQAVSVETPGKAAEVPDTKGNSHGLAEVGTGCQKS